MNGYYIFKWWITSIALVAPLIIGLTTVSHSGSFQVAFIAVFLGLLMSFPTLLIAYLVFLVLEQNKFSALASKFILNAVAVVAIFITFYLVLDTLFDSLVLIYVISVIFSSALFRISSKTQHLLTILIGFFSLLSISGSSQQNLQGSFVGLKKKIGKTELATDPKNIVKNMSGII